MPNKTIDALAYCPFYFSEAKTTITCEGIIGEKTVNTFKSTEEKTAHELNFCTGKTCASCGVYSAIMDNYAQGPRRSSHPLRH